MTKEPTYQNGVMQPENGHDNLDLYPRHKECPHCYYNLLRYKMRQGLSSTVFIDRCPMCSTDLRGW
jgi:hypothetical protein